MLEFFFRIPPINDDIESLYKDLLFYSPISYEIRLLRNIENDEITGFEEVYDNFAEYGDARVSMSLNRFADLVSLFLFLLNNMHHL